MRLKSGGSLILAVAIAMTGLLWAGSGAFGSDSDLRFAPGTACSLQSVSSQNAAAVQTREECFEGCVLEQDACLSRCPQPLNFICAAPCLTARFDCVEFCLMEFPNSNSQ